MFSNCFFFFSWLALMIVAMGKKQKGVKQKKCNKKIHRSMNHLPTRLSKPTCFYLEFDDGMNKIIECFHCVKICKNCSYIFFVGTTKHQSLQEAFSKYRKKKQVCSLNCCAIMQWSPTPRLKTGTRLWNLDLGVHTTCFLGMSLVDSSRGSTDVCLGKEHWSINPCSLTYGSNW